MRHGVGRLRLGDKGLVVLPRTDVPGKGDLRVLSYDHLVDVRLQQTDASGRGELTLTPRRGARIVIRYPGHQARVLRDLFVEVESRMAGHPAHEASVPRPRSGA
jgi:hypothetical protein